MMKTDFKKIWKLSIPYLKKGGRKDFLLHTEGVVKAMELLLKTEIGRPEILIPAAILHDTGWSKVPKNLQKSNNEKQKIESLKLHLKYSVPIINKILAKVNFDKKSIKIITNIVLAHKFKKPKELSKRLLIDADTLSDVFKRQFYSDCKAYNRTPSELYNFRKNNKFYTETAKAIFDKELEKRRKEFA